MPGCSALYKKLIITIAAVILTLGCAGIPILEPLPQPPTPLPTDTPQPSSTPSATRTPVPTSTPITPTLTLTPTLTFTETVTPSLTVTLTPSKTSSPRPLPTSPNPVTICFFSVGLGDAILIIAPDGKTMLIDGGTEDSGITGYLRSLGVRRIDVMVATHPHQDHVGGLGKVLSAFPVGWLYTNGYSQDDLSAYVHFREAVAAAGVGETQVARGATIHLGELTFYVLNPVSTANPDSNENSMVLRFSFRKTTVLLMADADHVSESNIMNAGLPVEADILKLGHHGSAESSSQAFLEAVSPSVAIYSSGYGNPWGFPEKATLERVRNVGAKIYGTDKNGSIFVTIGSKGYHIEVSKGE